METTVDLTQLNDLMEDALDFIEMHVLNIPNLIELAVVLISYLVARIASRSLHLVLERVLALAWMQKHSAQIGVIVTPLVMPLTWLVFAGMAHLVALQLSFPASILGFAVSLLTAWVVIRLSLNFIVDPWWSRAVAVFIWSVAALDILGLLTPTLEFMDQLAINLGSFRLSLLLVAKGVVTMVVLLWLANAGARLVESRLKGVAQFTPAQKVLFGKLVRVVLITLAILIGINMVGIDLTALHVFSGALGLGIGIGLQKVVSNLLSGVILLMDRSVKPGDVVSISGTYGWINSIGARYVSVVTRDGIEHLIPNEVLISTPVENWSHSNRLVRQRLPIGIDYQSNVHKAIELAVRAAGEFDRVLKNPAPRCLLKGYGDNSLDLELRVWIEDAEKGVSNIKSEIYLRIMDLFAENDIAFPYPQRDIHVKGPVHLMFDGTFAPDEPEPADTGAVEGGAVEGGVPDKSR